MDCTTGQTSTCTPCIMGCTIVYFPMYHGLYNLYLPHDIWLVQYINLPCNMGCRAVYLCHSSWTVQQYTYLIAHGLYKRPNQYIHPMHHGLYNASENINFPCNMGCTTACVPMHHGLYNSSNSTYSSMGYTTYLVGGTYL